MTAPALHAGRALLRPFLPSDVAGRARCGRDPQIVRMFGGTSRVTEFTPMTVPQAQAWYDRAVMLEPRALHWAVEYDDRFVGTARLHDVSTADRSARYAVGILDGELLGQGLGTEITLEVLRYSFDVLRLHRVELRVLAYNTRAIHCYTRCGFREEGRLRESALVDGVWHDDVLMGILAGDAP